MSAAWSRSVSWLQAKRALAHIGLLRKETEGQFWYTFPKMNTIIFGEWETRHSAFIECSFKMKGLVMMTDTRQLRWPLYGV